MKAIERIAQKLIRDGIAEADEEEILVFGLTQGLSMISGILMTLLISALFGCLSEGIIFLILFCPLRVYAGGYHAKTRIRCFCSSVFAMIVIFAAVRFMEMPVGVCVVLSGIATIIIGLMVPQDNPNKRLDGDEYIIYKKKARGYLAVQVIVFVAVMVLGKTKMVNVIVWAQCFQVLLILAEKNNHIDWTI